MITVYDISETTHPETIARGASPFVRTITFVLRYKKLEYEIIPVGFTNIERVARELGASPTITEPKPKYTVPFIKDSTTGKVISDSVAIAQYLDTTYPDTSLVVPPGSEYLQRLFRDQILNLTSDVFKVWLRPKLIKYFSKEIQEMIPTSDPTPEELSEALKKGKEDFEKLSQSLNGGAPFRSFIMGGDKPTFGDLHMVAFLHFLLFIEGDESAEWKEIRSWANGWLGWEVDQILKLVL
ncbi:hypothetical protein PQX77_004722 [Marasmius sp. AFHP31]|nr:hypothetical protein PQX77_004722 [Marasmius sp. AFHP31]